MTAFWHGFLVAVPLCSAVGVADLLFRRTKR